MLNSLSLIVASSSDSYYVPHDSDTSLPSSLSLLLRLDRSGIGPQLLLSSLTLLLQLANNGITLQLLSSFSSYESILESPSPLISSAGIPSSALSLSSVSLNQSHVEVSTSSGSPSIPMAPVSTLFT